MKKIVTFGEVMMRLSVPGFGRFEQATNFDVTYAGAEANVAVSCAYFGAHALHVTVLPDHALGQAAAQSLRKVGIDISSIKFQDGRLGTYYLENGIMARGSKIVYDRVDSAFSQIEKGSFNWDEILQGADWFHWSGITPALSRGAADACLEAIEAANRLGVWVSGDIYFRSNLWQYGKKPQDVLPRLTAGCDLVLANADNFKEIYGVDAPDFETGCLNMKKIFPRIKYFTDTTREQISASHNKISARLFDGTNTYQSAVYDLTHIVDRIGGGDAYVAGLLYGIQNNAHLQTAVEFAAAATALKHGIEGDYNLVSVAEIETLMGGDVSGRLKR